MNTPYLPLRPAASMVRWAFALLAFALGSLAQAAEEAKIPFQIGSDDATVTLKAFMQQSGREIMYPVAAVKGTKTNPVNGEFTPKEALDQMLAGTDLAATRTKSGVLAVNRVSDPNVGRAIAEAKSVRPDRSGRTELDEKGEPVVKLDTFEVFGRKTLNMDIRRSENDIQPYQILDSKRIATSGAQNVEDFLRQRLTTNASFQTFGQSVTTSGGRSTSSINLRGLGAAKTLVLVDGRRAAGVNVGIGTQGQPDLNRIPVEQIERIEILSSSASAIYGGAAMGGVVNVVLRKEYNGGQISYSYDTPIGVDAPLQKIYGTYGLSLEKGRTQLTISGSYTDGKPLYVNDRVNLINRYISQILNNSSAFLFSSTSPFFGATPNIAAVRPRGGSQPNLILRNGTSLGSPITSIPPGTSPGVDITAGLLANAGTYNLQLSPGTGARGLGNTFDFVPRDKSFTTNMRRQMTGTLDLFLEYANHRTRDKFEYNPFSQSPITVAASSPVNPFQQAVSVSVPLRQSYIGKISNGSRALTLGAIAKLPAAWIAEFDYTWSETSATGLLPQSDAAALSADINSGLINPFVDTVAYPPDITKYLGMYMFTGKTSLDDFALRVSGPAPDFLQLRATFTTALEHREEATHDHNIGQVLPITGNAIQQLVLGHKQAVDSIYIETKMAPTKWVIKGTEKPMIEWQLAARAERYETDANQDAIYLSPSNLVSQNRVVVPEKVRYTAVSPTAGIRIGILEDLHVRSSISKGFLPPTPSQLLADPSLRPFASTVFDPQTGQSYGGFLYTSGGNIALKPEWSTTTNIGLVWEPTGGIGRGLRFSLNYYRIKQVDLITAPPAALVLATPDLAGRVLRDATTGRVVQMDLSLLNATQFNTSGWDASLGYEHESSLGRFGLDAIATIVTADEREYAPSGKAINYLGYPAEGGTGKIKGNANLTWERNSWSAGYSVTYYSGYNQYFSPGSPTQVISGVSNTFFTAPQGALSIPSQNIHSIYVGFHWNDSRQSAERRIWTGLLSGVTIQAGVKNIFNTAPPLDVFNDNYFSPYGDMRLRSFWITIKKAF